MKSQLLLKTHFLSADSKFYLFIKDGVDLVIFIGVGK